MKKTFLLLLCLLLMSGCTAEKTPVKENMPPSSLQTRESNAEAPQVRAVWLTYYEWQALIKDCGEEQYRERITSALQELKGMGFNTVTAQVRPCADAFYPSAYFPCSQYCFDTQGAEMPYDPLKILCEAAASEGLMVEAWINPYRVSQENDINALCESNIARQWAQNQKTKARVFIGKKHIYFNPASDAVIRLIVDGVAEIVRNYPVSAIHFDDYFYPTTSEKIDKKAYKKYQKSGGELSLADFRREKVSELIRRVYQSVKEINPAVRFGVSPAANIRNDYHTLYADVEKWMTEEGYLDYVCPQVYFGFRNISQPFMFTVKKWMYLAKCDLYIGLPLYKADQPDPYAAKEDKSIINEFINHDNIIARQITYLSKLPQIKGFYVFSYGCLHDDRCAAEVKNMLEVMQ